jgi:hypothetical protein
MAKNNTIKADPSEEAIKDTKSVDRVSKDTDIRQTKHLPKLSHGLKRLKKLIKHRLFWIPLVFIISVLIILVLLPATRYKLLGSFWKQNYQLEVVDLKTNQPVIGADVKIGSYVGHTNNDGKLTLKLPVGNQTVLITKQYFANLSEKVLVPIHSSSIVLFKLKATGLFVPIKVINKLTNSPVQNVLISADGNEVKTNASGQATLVLPANVSTAKAQISGSGFNSNNVSIQIATNQSVAANTFTITPQGSVYFLSNASGSISADSANLDGSNAQVVMAGNGNEDNAQLFTSGDGQYLALVVGDTDFTQHLYVVNTSNGSSNTVNPKATSYEVVGWTSDDHLIYIIRDNQTPVWQTGTSDLMTYNASDGVSTILSAAQGIGTATNNSAHQDFTGEYILPNNNILYLDTWNADDFNMPNLLVMNLPGQSTIPQQTLNIVGDNGSAPKTLLSEPADNTNIFGNEFSPFTVTFQVGITDSTNNSYYIYQNGSLTSTSQQNYDYYNNQTISPSNNYLISPDGDEYLYSKNVNGHTGIFTENANGSDWKQIATLDPTYSIYGWANENYILVSNNNNELYVMPVTGVASQSDLYKVTNYYAN